MTNTAIIIGGGSSVLDGLALGLKEQLQNKFTIGCNFCYSEDTEVFTNEGWKYFKDLTGNELPLTREYDGDTKWTKILKYNKQFYQGEMILLNNKQIDLLVTPNHDFYLLKKRNTRNLNQYIKVPATYFNFRKIGSEYSIPQVFNWKGNKEKFFILPSIIKCKRKIEPKKIILMKNWVRFMGIFLSEGWTCEQKKYHMTLVGISQSKKANLKKYNLIRALLKKLPFNFHETPTDFIVSNKQLFSYLSQFGKSHDKFIPREIKELSPYYLNKLLFWYIIGDGTRNKYKTARCFTVSKQLSDDIQEIFYKTHKRARIVKRKNASRYLYWIEQKIQGKHLSVQQIKNTNVFYNGFVYDITIEAPHTLFVRRNGKCCWSGNSFYTFDNTINTFCDSDFYRGQLLNPPEPINLKHIEKLKSLPLLIGLMKNEINTMNYGNTLFLKDASPYYREKMIKKGVYFHNLTGIFTLSLVAWLLDFKGTIFLLGYDWIRGLEEERKTKPHENYRNVKTHFYDIKHRGQGLVRYYERHEPNFYFKPFVAEKELRIYNVSPQSNITSFPKISYEEMFKLLDNETFNQDELRTIIKDKITNAQI